MKILKLLPALLLALLINNVNLAQNTYPWPSTGNVGIGTASPDQLLTVNGITHIGNDLILTRTDNFTNGASIVLDNVISKALFLQKIGGGNIDVINLMGTSIGLNGNATIGGQAGGPGVAKLNVQTNTSGDGIWLTNDGSGYGGNSGFIKIHGPSLPQGGWNGITLAGDAGIVFGTANQTTNNGFVIAPWRAGFTGLRVDKDGNVGICTSDTKNYQLAVNGAAIFTKAVVKLNANWPDYVFKREYQLPSLDSVAKYIQANNHLPEMPSADSVQNAGLDLGDNQAALLKKIEELTLYIIELNKKVELLEKKNMH